MIFAKFIVVLELKLASDVLSNSNWMCETIQNWRTFDHQTGNPKILIRYHSPLWHYISQNSYVIKLLLCLQIVQLPYVSINDVAFFKFLLQLSSKSVWPKNCSRFLTRKIISLCYFKSNIKCSISTAISA